MVEGKSMEGTVREIDASGHAPFVLDENVSVTMDLIRAIAAELVVVGHGMCFFGVLPRMQPPHAPYIQRIAVVVFFLLSGFLITYSVHTKVRRRVYCFGEYFIDRFARIFSGYIPGLILIAVADAFMRALHFSAYTFGSAFNIRTFIGNLLMLQEYPLFKAIAQHAGSSEVKALFSITTFGSGRPLWTLAVEWWIYLLYGWLILVPIPASSARRLRYGVCLVLLLVVPVYNLVGGWGDGLSLTWLMGVAMFLGFRYGRLPSLSMRMSVSLGLFLLALAAVRVFRTMNEYDISFALLLAGALFLFLHAARSVPSRCSERWRRIIRFAADYSFTLYMIHYTILVALMNWMGRIAPATMLVVALVLCNVVAAALAYFTEMKHKALASRLKRWCGLSPTVA